MSLNNEVNPNADYYTARAVEERRLAMASADRKVRAIHLEMADRYDALAHGATAVPLPPEQQQAG